MGTSRQPLKYSDDEEHQAYYEVFSCFDLEEGRVEQVDRVSKGPWKELAKVEDEFSPVRGE